jgi:hypothetical protein
MIREYLYGPNDTVYVWDPSDFRRPVFNAKTWGSNVHAAAASGQYLYITTYESYKDGSGAQDTGEVVRIDMQDCETACKNDPVRDAIGNENRPTFPNM